MAKDTPLHFRNLVIYEIYVRNHGPQGTFAEVEADLERIHGMGVDVIWFMPIHPIGKVARKGRLGSPYSIVDYRAVNPEYGTQAEFTRLVEKAHGLGLKVMIDVVYNHTAHDSTLVHEHPEFFHQDASGRPVTTVPDWSDVIDLKHPQPALTRYLIDSLNMWARLGVDGFRCDVASLLPEEFWLQARRELAEVKPGVIWLAESVHAAFVAYRRSIGLDTLSDSQLYPAFDLTYDYDIWPIWQAVLTGRAPVKRYLEMLRFQDAIYPSNYIKLRYVENHDMPRIFGIVPLHARALAWTAFAAFDKGAFLIYAGQESAAAHKPSLFDSDKIEWKDYPLQSYLTRLVQIKKDAVLRDGQFTILADAPALQAAWTTQAGGLYGLFNVEGQDGTLEVHLLDGEYEDVLNGGSVTVQDGKMSIPASAAILRFEQKMAYKPLFCELLDVSVESAEIR